jgi:Fic family protein/DNA-binding XRE family transcriptional regulator
MTIFGMTKKSMKSIKEYRLSAGMLVRDLAAIIGADPSAVSRFESGERLPSKKQVQQIAQALNAPVEELLIEWLSLKILREIEAEPLALKAMQVAEDAIKYGRSNDQPSHTQVQFEETFSHLSSLQSSLSLLRPLAGKKVFDAIGLEYTTESNRIEGNTLSLQETELIVNQGITIAGKSMREHLEAINHHDAIQFITELASSGKSFSERDLLQVHQLILKGIDRQNAGVYRKVQVMISGSNHVPPQPYLLQKEMESLFIWYNQNKNFLHPVQLAAEFHQKLVSIHPFIDGNGRTSRLMMNLILIQNGYVIANIKGDMPSRIRYYQALEACHTQNDNSGFIQLVADYELQALNRIISILQEQQD